MLRDTSTAWEGNLQQSSLCAPRHVNRVEREDVGEVSLCS